MQNTSAETLVDVQGGLKFAKSPLWYGKNLLFLDIHDRCIKSTDVHGAVRTVGSLTFLPGFFGLLPDGGLVVGDAWRRKIFRWALSGTKQIADLSHVAGFCLSDGVVDCRDGMYVGDVGFDFLDPLIDPAPNGVVVYVGADGKSSIAASNLFFPGGMVITPDCSTLIVAEKLNHCLTAFEIQPDGSLRNRRVWAQFEDDVNPDGICLDRDGAIWAATSGPRALRVVEGGATEHLISTNQPVFATMLGGPERRHLLLCTAASDDPVMTRRVPSATIDVAEVATPGIGIPPQQECARLENNRKGRKNGH